MAANLAHSLNAEWSDAGPRAPDWKQCVHPAFARTTFSPLFLLLLSVCSYPLAEGVQIDSVPRVLTLGRPKDTGRLDPDITNLGSLLIENLKVLELFWGELITCHVVSFRLLCISVSVRSHAIMLTIVVGERSLSLAPG
ncbi:MAG: hypothetical protein ACLQU3_32305 [Limisphaerales bacterium]